MKKKLNKDMSIIEIEDAFIKDMVKDDIPRQEARERLAEIVELKYKEELRIADERWQRAELKKSK